jgi:ubiquilin
MLQASLQATRAMSQAGINPAVVQRNLAGSGTGLPNSGAAPPDLAALMGILSGAGGAGAGAGGPGGLGGNPLAGLGAGARGPPADFAGLLSMLGGAGGGGFGGVPAPPPVANPEVAYASQLQQLQDMGFFDQQENIRALQATGGNVNAAVDRLLSS